MNMGVFYQQLIVHVMYILLIDNRYICSKKSTDIVAFLVLYMVFGKGIYLLRVPTIIMVVSKQCMRGLVHVECPHILL